jgi:Uma2 family endonuclease
MQTHAETPLPASQPQVQPSPQPPLQPEPERRVTLYGVSWETYEHLLSDLADRSVPRLTFAQGVLEIMSPTAEQEEYNRTLAALVEVVATELRINIRRLGSTTFKREDLAKGFEPDTCFYIQSVPRIRGKRRIELPQDPPPDLLIEIDISSSSLDRFPLFAQVGVPEVWRYDGSRVQFLQLTGEQYLEVPQSLAFPILTSEVVTRFLEESLELESTEWSLRLRDWVRQQGKKQ